MPFQFPSGSRQPSPDEGSFIDYTEESNTDQDIQSSNKWVPFVVNLNNGTQNGITVLPREPDTPISPPCVMAQSFETRWPGPSTNGSAHPPLAFHLNSHKHLDHADRIEELVESDDSPPYLPANGIIKPTAPLPDEEYVNEIPV
jgi:hypothetical protein